MDGPRNHTKGSKPNRQRQMSYDTTYMWNLNMIQMNLKNRNRLTDLENKLMVTKGKVTGRNKLEGYD